MKEIGIIVALAVLMVCMLPWVVPKLLASKWWWRFWGSKLVICALALVTVAAGPRIENWTAWTEPNGCKFATFTLSDDGERGNYYLTCNSPEFPQFYLPADFWAPVTRIEYVGAASYRVALYTNFSCAVFRLEKIQ